ncbi:DUF222 domain-containing protein [Leifsonia sp. H3M29-4]|uniref:HNH endonuclease signature motif containing protein n=1 Tax=Salinibacterium metalliresistens TaxID=3031321 RepID=UPI0023DCD65C|nr:HNH endonuclease signature motif containing protein [Salinibacterium metalliresistens]MDF1479212.1 DUF222 domain-containing protein [Salinibacterium metalliresistens]
MNPTDLLELNSGLLGGLPDPALLERQRSVAELGRRVDAAAALIADEIARRSRPELGHDGLAQRLGARTPAVLVQQLTGATARQANSLVRAGAHLAATLDSADPTAAGPSPSGIAAGTAALWLAPAATALAHGAISLDAFEAIRAGLGAPDDHITTVDLTDAATTLVARAPAITVERLAADARDLRAELDLGRVTDLEHALRERRSLHLTRQADGMTRLIGLLDPESAATVTTAIDAATSPRRGGPRFVDPTARDAADALIDDRRTTEQIALDALVELVRIGTVVDDSILLGTGRTVTLHVTATDLDRRAGIARLEGQTAPISVRTAERHACDATIVPILFDADRQVVDVGLEYRHFTGRQRQALAARDGGCRFPDCARPPSWTEAHHVTHWQHGGRTDIANGILLCRHHHLLIHNNGWTITREAGNYFVTPPPRDDPDQRRIPAPSKSRLHYAAG